MNPEGDIRLRPSSGMRSFIGDNGDLVIPCGSENSISIGWGVRGAIAFSDDGFTSGQNLTWETFEFTCPDDETGDLLVASGLGAEIVAGTFSRRFENIWEEEVPFEQWMLNSGSGMSTTLTVDGDLLVPCGSGNSLSPGSTARIALAREGSSDRLTWDTYEFTCPSDISPEDYFVPESNVDTDFVAVLFTPRNWEDSGWLPNPEGGMLTHLPPQGELRIPCDGRGNSLNPGHVLRLALGYE